MASQDFAQAWGEEDPLCRFARIELDRFELAPATVDFLTTVGLPSDAAPFLSFGYRDEHVMTVAERWKVSSNLSRYVGIGHTDNGDPITIDSRDGSRIDWLDHEDNFRPTLMNSSVGQLAQSLLAYRGLVEATLEMRGDDAFLDGNIPIDLIDELEHSLREIDEVGFSGDTFWSLETELLRAEAPD